ncbi:Hypothetical protein MAGb_0060 [Mycoplasmopsis agalactiae 14628]|uniref:Uncharacterized protein n=1 Tax=Mycoplasmopsis agalactiae 14628 TaxID=1110504 RepID=I5D719_MYCAA|nr:pilin [Mycoplasmopsis agalactiae]EIN15478.1 Hypothetical protein MAGb_0060 [Mycoplasmopsis agalactiae 14628]
MKNEINTAGLTKLQSGIDQIINVVFGIFTGITVVIVIALLIWAMVKNQQEEDPMKRKQNTHKILWGAAALVLIVLAWGLTSFIRNAQGNANAVINSNSTSGAASFLNIFTQPIYYNLKV